MGYVLHKTGLYRLAADNSFFSKIEHSFVNKAQAVGKEWRQAVESHESSKGVTAKPLIRLPKEVVDSWKHLLKVLNKTIYKLNDKDKVVLLNLFAYSDEAFCDVGLHTCSDSTDKTFYEAVKELIEVPSGTEAASLCRIIRKELVCVLPKLVVPQTGLTIRNCSHYLALWPRDEISPQWVTLDESRWQSLTEVNLLLLPWPKKLLPNRFKEESWDRCGRSKFDEDSGHFSYNPQPLGREIITKKLPLILKEALSKVSALHGIIFPEACLSCEEEMLDIRRVLDKREFKEKLKSAFILCGIIGNSYEASLGQKPTAKVNRAVLSYRRNGVMPVALNQSKHHRWLFDSEQAKSYGISHFKRARLWENVKIENRKLHFVVLREKFLFSYIICEDLARQEPAARLIRAVGPNLLIALLLDGPQLETRWPARYATVLADDPGCSVLTVTSAGMVSLSNEIFFEKKRSEAKNIGKELTRGEEDEIRRKLVVGLWKDSSKSEPVKITISPDDDAVLLKLELKKVKQQTLDGRTKEVPIYTLDKRNITVLKTN